MAQFCTCGTQGTGRRSAPRCPDCQSRLPFSLRCYPREVLLSHCHLVLLLPGAENQDMLLIFKSWGGRRRPCEGAGIRVTQSIAPFTLQSTGAGPGQSSHRLAWAKRVVSKEKKGGWRGMGACLPLEQVRKAPWLLAHLRSRVSGDMNGSKVRRPGGKSGGAEAPWMTSCPHCLVKWP